MSITDIGKQNAEESSGSSTSDAEEYSRFDVTGMTFVGVHPTAAPAGTASVLRYFPGDPDEGMGDRGYNGLVVDDPYLVNDEELEATVIVDNDKQRGDDLKVVDLSDRQTQILTATGPVDFFDEDDDDHPGLDFSEVNGIDFASNTTYGDVRAFISADQAQEMVEEATEADGRSSVTELETATAVQIATLRANDINTMSDLADASTDEIEAMGGFGVDTCIIKMTGNAGERAARTLDVHGGEAADVERNEDGEAIIDEESGWPTYNGGLIEYVDDFIDNDDEDDWVPSRFARDTELRPDAKGKEVAFLLQRQDEVMDNYDGDSYFTTLLSRADESDSWDTLEPTAEYEPSDLVVSETRWLEEAYPSDERIYHLRQKQGVDVDDDLSERVDTDAVDSETKTEAPSDD